MGGWGSTTWLAVLTAGKSDWRVPISPQVGNWTFSPSDLVLLWVVDFGARKVDE